MDNKSLSHSILKDLKTRLDNAIEEKNLAQIVEVEEDFKALFEDPKRIGAEAVGIGTDIKIAIANLEEILDRETIFRLLQLAERLETQGAKSLLGTKKIRFFLSSPGDVMEEREVVKQAIKKVQNDPLYKEKVSFELIDWSDPLTSTPMLATMTPQDAISQGLARPSECDIVVVILWSRMGTPLPKNAKYKKAKEFQFKNSSGLPVDQYYSGTEWEFIDAVLGSEKFRTRYGYDLPIVALYRSRKTPQLYNSDRVKREKLSQQFELVEDFFASFNYPDGSPRRAYNEFSSTSEFEVLFESHLRRMVAQLLTLPKTSALPSPTFSSKTDELRIEWPREISPFPGLRSFTTKDAPIFFGREKEINELIGRLASPDCRFLAIVGASGSGKSSLVGAGLIPRLKEGSVKGSQDWLLPTFHQKQNQWAGLRFTPGEASTPLWALANRLAPLIGKSVRQVAVQLENDPGSITEFMEMALKNHPDWGEIVFFVDQFEEIFQHTQSSEIQQAFIELLQKVVNFGRARVIITLRSDFADRCAEFSTMNSLLQDNDRSTFWLSRPKSGSLYEMISRPAKVTGYCFEDGLDWKILQDTGDEPGSLALVAYTLEQLWQQRSQDGCLLGEVYASLGDEKKGLSGVEGAIGTQAQRAFLAISDAAKNAFSAVFRKLVEINEVNGSVTRKRAQLRSLITDDACRELIYALTDARLLVTRRDETKSEIVELAHEALFRSWPLLVEWLNEVREDLVLRRQVTVAAQIWKNNDEDDAYLWPQERLDLVESMVERRGIDWLDPENDVLQAFIQPEFERIWAKLNVVSTEHRDRAYFGERLDMLSDCKIRPGIGIVSGSLASLPTSEQTNLPVSAGDIRLWGNADAEFGYEEEHIGLPDILWVTIPGRQINIKKYSFSFPSFLLAKYPVTYRQYRYFLDCEDGFCDKNWYSGLMVDRWHYKKSGGQSHSSDNHPAERISWFDAIAYCRWMNHRLGLQQLPMNISQDTLYEFPSIRLPTEWEWQAAALGIDSWNFPWGSSWKVNQANTRESGLGRTTTVGVYPEGDSRDGAMDMCGNVWEWCLNEYKNIPRLGLSSPYPRSWRGGSFLSDKNESRGKHRSGERPEERAAFVGFRVCISWPDIWVD